MLTPAYKIELVAAAQTYPLRHRVLRPNVEIYKPNPEDALPTTFHVGAFDEGKLIGIASFTPAPYADPPVAAFPKVPRRGGCAPQSPTPKAQQLFTAKAPFRLRGMATDPSYRGRGVGTQVLDFAFARLAEKGCDLLWCHAREAAFAFYEKTGFAYFGEMFDVPEIGPHKIMYRRGLAGGALGVGP